MVGTQVCIAYEWQCGAVHSLVDNLEEAQVGGHDGPQGNGHWDKEESDSFP